MNTLDDISMLIYTIEGKEAMKFMINKFENTPYYQCKISPFFKSGGQCNIKNTILGKYIISMTVNRNHLKIYIKPFISNYILKSKYEKVILKYFSDSYSYEYNEIRLKIHNVIDAQNLCNILLHADFNPE